VLSRAATFWALSASRPEHPQERGDPIASGGVAGRRRHHRQHGLKDRFGHLTAKTEHDEDAVKPTSSGRGFDIHDDAAARVGDTTGSVNHLDGGRAARGVVGIIQDSSPCSGRACAARPHGTAAPALS
jgi:hypothetical protein